MRKVVSLFMLLLTLWSLGIFGSAGAASGQVSIQGFAFNPSSLSLQAPATITWTNQDGFLHTVTSDAGTFNSGDIPPGGSYVLNLGVPGTYNYHCARHPGFMFGTIVVTPVDGPDLYVESIVAQEVSTMRQNITVTVRNIGNASTSTPFETTLGYVYKGTFRELTTNNSPALGPNGSYSFSFIWSTTGKVGNFTVRAIADSADQVIEANESNNTTDRTVTLLAPIPAVDVFEP